MKHFLQILVTGSVLFILLGLFNQEESIPVQDKAVDDLEQVLHADGLLSYHHSYSSKNSKFTEREFFCKCFIDIRKAHEITVSNIFRAEYKNSLTIYTDILQALLHMKGVFPHLQSELEILS